MSLKIILLFCKVFLNFSKIHQFRGIFWSWRQWLINLLFKFHSLTLMFLDQFLLNFLGLLLILGHFLIPIIIELCNFFNMGHLYLLFLIFMFRQHFSSFISFNLGSHFGKFLFCQISLYVFSSLFALFLMSIKDLPIFNLKRTYINRYLLLNIKEC